MIDEAEYLLNKKLEHIQKDYDRACSLAERVDSRVNTIRSLNITVIVAYLGWMSQSGGPNHILPLLAAIFAFWVLEALAGASARFYFFYTLTQADGVFYSTAIDMFHKSVQEYTFLDRTQSSQYKKWLTCRGKVHRLLFSLINCETFLFYFLPLSISCGFHSKSCKFKFPIFLCILFVGVAAFSFGHWCVKHWRQVLRILVKVRKSRRKWSRSFEVLPVGWCRFLGF